MSKSMIYDFLKGLNQEYILSNTLLVAEDDKVKVDTGKEVKSFSSDKYESVDYDILDYLEENGDVARICYHCGKPMQAGFTDCCEFYACEDCFEVSMNEIYYKWRRNDTGEEGENGGYYDYLACEDDFEWVDTGIFYTEWY